VTHKFEPVAYPEMHYQPPRNAPYGNTLIFFSWSREGVISSFLGPFVLFKQRCYRGVCTVGRQPREDLINTVKRWRVDNLYE
jgi:hypothetical protein